MRWQSSSWPATYSWRAAGSVFAGLAVVAAAVIWFGTADERAEARHLERTYQISDPLWRGLGLGPVRVSNGLEREPCGGGSVGAVSTGRAVPKATTAIAATTSRLRADGWRVTDLVQPKTRGAWAHATRGADTVIVWPDESPYPPGREILHIEVRLNDCVRFSAPAGTVEEPNCARGGRPHCVDSRHLQ